MGATPSRLAHVVALSELTDGDPGPDLSRRLYATFIGRQLPSPRCLRAIGARHARAPRSVTPPGRLLPAALAAYTAHGLTHLAQSAVLRSYTPGVATVPLVIAPYSVWA
jgi:hypothetical protein